MNWPPSKLFLLLCLSCGDEAATCFFDPLRWVVKGQDQPQSTTEGGDFHSQGHLSRAVSGAIVETFSTHVEFTLLLGG